MALGGSSFGTVQRTEARTRKKENKEDAGHTAQKLMLTWLTSYPAMFDTIAGYITPADFITPLYHKVAELVFVQHEEGEVLSLIHIFGIFQWAEGETNTR